MQKTITIKLNQNTKETCMQPLTTIKLNQKQLVCLERRLTLAYSSTIFDMHRKLVSKFWESFTK